MGNKIVTTTATDYLFCEDNGIAVQECHALLPDLGQLDRLFHLLVAYLEKKELSQQNLTNVKLVCEEVFVNIVHYSGTEKDIIMLLGHSDSSLYVQFIDDGIAFNPLTQPPPPPFGEKPDDVKIGGLGIMMIKKISEQAHYARKNNRNNFLVSIKC
jgi:anti-sigma regulatory factor (Ser/Thr protein kinase)